MSERALGFNASAMHLSDVLDDRQTQTGAAHFTATRFVGAIKALENAGQIRFRDPNSGIADADYRCLSAATRFQADLPAFTRIFQGIV